MIVGSLTRLIVLVAVAMAATLVSALAARRTPIFGWVVLGSLVLAGLGFPTSSLVNPTTVPGPIPPLLIYLLPSAALPLAAMLASWGLRNLLRGGHPALRPGGVAVEAAKRMGWGEAACLILAALLLGGAVRNLYWLLVWDRTDDPLGALWMILPAFAAMYSGLLWAAVRPGQRRAGLAYTLAVGALLAAGTSAALLVDVRGLTRDRAQRVAYALDHYYDRQGRYPETLGELVPRFALALPGPVIINGLGWCYEADEASYHLGFVNRNHWSDPRLSVRLASSRGADGLSGTLCRAEIAELRARFPRFFSDDVVEEFGR